MRKIILLLTIQILIASCGTAQNQNDTTQTSSDITPDKITKTEAEWKEILTGEEFVILRQQGTERAFTGDLLNNTKAGTYTCAACGNPLFAADTKFKSGTGWPSFFEFIDGRVAEKTDDSYGMHRVEVVCSKCDSHLGHLFDDGPNPTGLRYCINSVSLNFEEKE